MSDWTAGYVTEVDYTFGYYTELNPHRIPLAFRFAGLDPPQCLTACELGFGQGISANIHAAASGARWFGTDFNPAHAGLARAMAAASGAGADLVDESFAEFCARDDLPQFDFIGLHGIWTWISDENRAIIVDFVRRKLAVGGVLYVSYNTQPGWAAMAPMRDLLAEHARVMGAPAQGIVRRVDDALAFVDKLMATKPIYATANPRVAERLQKIRDLNRNYVAHEYFNRDWLPMSFSRMKQWLDPAMLSYACSAHYLDNVDAMNLTPEQRGMLSEIPDAMFRETVRDFMVNQSFRRDYWIRGARKVNPLEQAEALRAQRVLLAQPRDQVTLKVTGGAGEATLQEAVYGPILDALADHQERTIQELERVLKDRGITFTQLVQAVVVLTGAHILVAAQDDAVVSRARQQTDRLNAFICAKARGSGDITFLASPVSGGGTAVGRMEQMFLLARAQGKTSSSEWAEFAWQTLAAQGQKLVRDGKTVETAEENIAQLRSDAKSFTDKRLPVLKALGIA